MELSPSISDGERQLLEEGLRTYMEAMTAVLAFRRRIHTVSREILARRLIDFVAATGVASSNGKIADVVTPDEDKWHGREAFVGVSVDIGFPSSLYGTQYCGLCWDVDGVYCCASIYLNRAKDADAIRAQLQTVSKGTIQGSKGDIWLTPKIAAEDAITFPAKLDAVVDDWVKHWSGITQFLVTMLRK